MSIPKGDISTLLLEYPVTPAFFAITMRLPTDGPQPESTSKPGSIAGPSSPSVSPIPSGQTPEITIHPTMHDEFWLYDGSIVLAVEHTLFRVHRTILANHSEVFADLFTVPQPEDEDTIDGCHVVRLYDDEKDFVDLLKAMYHPE